MNPMGVDITDDDANVDQGSVGWASWSSIDVELVAHDAIATDSMSSPRTEKTDQEQGRWMKEP